MTKWIPDNIPTKKPKKPTNKPSQTKPKKQQTKKPTPEAWSKILGRSDFQKHQETNSSCWHFLKKVLIKKKKSYSFSSYCSLVSSQFSNFWHGTDQSLIVVCYFKYVPITEVWSSPRHHRLKQLLQVTGRAYRFSSYTCWEMFQCCKTHWGSPFLSLCLQVPLKHYSNASTEIKIH